MGGEYLGTVATCSVLLTRQHDKRRPTRTCILQGHGVESERFIIHAPSEHHTASV